MSKLDWFPLYIARIKGSSAWQRMKDYQRGWYMTLLLEAADNTAMPGYLPLTHDLWKLAGAESRSFWESEIRDQRDLQYGRPRSALVMACFKTQEIGGVKWLYNPRLSDTLREQWQRKQNKDRKHRKISPSLSISELPIVNIYEDYPRKDGGREAALKAIGKAVSRVAAEKNCEPIEACEYLHMAVLEYAKSPRGQKPAKGETDFRPYSSTWFNKGFYDADREAWKGAQSGRSGAQDKQERSFDAIRRATENVCGAAGEMAGDVESQLPEPGDNRGNGNGVAGGVGAHGRADWDGEIRDGIARVHEAGGTSVRARAGGDTRPHPESAGRQSSTAVKGIAEA